MTNRIWTFEYGVAAALIALVVMVWAPGSPEAHAAEPEIVYQNLNEGDELSEPPYVIQMCFSQPIDVRDQPDGGDWDFDVTTPQNIGSAIRIVFQPNAYGVAMYPVAPATIPAVPTNDGGGWRFSYRVADSESGDPLEGAVNFTINEDADPIPRATPPSCTPEGGTGSSTPDPVVQQPSGSATETPRPTRTPRTTGSATPASSSESPATSGSATPGAVDEGDDGGTDTLLIVLLAGGVVGLIGGLGAGAYFIRKRR